MMHEMKLAPSPFQKIKSGKKRVEIRLYDEKRRRISVGDHVVFTQVQSGEKLEKEVIALHIYASFAQLYASFPAEALGYTAEEGSPSPDDMYAYYSALDERKHGVVGIELR